MISLSNSKLQDDLYNLFTDNNLHQVGRQSVYYSDKRTSKKCKCSNCSKDNPMLGLGNKCIGISYIILICSRLQREREIQLKKLFGKY